MKNFWGGTQQFHLFWGGSATNSLVLGGVYKNFPDFGGGRDFFGKKCPIMTIFTLFLANFGGGGHIFFHFMGGGRIKIFKFGGGTRQNF